MGLQSLKVAEISGCNRLKCLFSPSLARSLVSLEQLKIVYCDRLEHIITTEFEIDDIEIDYMEIDDDYTDPKGGHDLYLPLLPKLMSLEIRNCLGLKYVFRVSLAQDLPQLKSVSITNSSQLKQVFNEAKEVNVVDHGIALPRLQHLELGNLINLSGFSSEKLLLWKS